MKEFTFISLLLIVLVSTPGYTQEWSKGVTIPPDGRPNPYELSEPEFLEAMDKGRRHALYYPVTETGILLPYFPIKRLIEGDTSHPLKKLISEWLGVLSPFESFDEMEGWLGLLSFPSPASENKPFHLPEKERSVPDHRMGLTFMETPRGLGFTISCAQCHTGNLFGKRIIGMSQRFPRANDFFSRGIMVTPKVGEGFFKWATEATEGETLMFRDLKATIPYIAAKKPVQLGLDTSLAQVALSLAKRAQDAYASKIPTRRRANLMDHHVADSKPAVWWNVKYKNRWLSDGSVVSGNPIFTNIIWNEIGRGADLQKIEGWLADNAEAVKELTTAVFSSEAPHITDFFPAERIDELAARKGEVLFNQACARCHGVYEKNWSLPEASMMTAEERLKTSVVRYPEKTFVVDVGTDPGRWQGMVALTPLNELSVSKANGIVIEPQRGYVPPPLVGIWARWPYFHNNSAPSLCAVLTRGEERPVTYWARSADDPERDFDFECNGYPVGGLTFDQPRDHLYDTRKRGLSRFGHDEGIFLSQGHEIFTRKEKHQIIMFLKTL